MKLYKTVTAGLGLALVAGTCANGSAAVDQSQLLADVAIPIANPTGQSFTAGLTGSLTSIDLFSNGPASSSNDVTFEVLAGDGTGGTLLGSTTQTTPPGSYDAGVGAYLVSFDTSGLGINVSNGSQYTFLITSVTGSGDLADRGVIAQNGNPYSGGEAYEAYYGFLPSSGDDMTFQTHVTALPEPASLGLLGLAGLGLVSRRRRKA